MVNVVIMGASNSTSESSSQRSPRSSPQSITIDIGTYQNHLDELRKLKSDVALLTNQLQETKDELLTKDNIITESKLSQNISVQRLLAIQKETLNKENKQLDDQLKQYKQKNEEEKEKFNTLNSKYTKVQEELQHSENREVALKQKLVRLKNQLNQLNDLCSGAQSQLKLYQSDELCLIDELNTVQNQLKQATEEYQRNKENYEKEYEILYERNSKIQLELQLYKKNECMEKFSKLDQQLLIFRSEVDSSVKNRIANEGKLKEKMLMYNKCKQILQQCAMVYSSNVCVEMAIRKYKDVYEQNDRKINYITKRLNEICRISKTVSGQLKTDSSNTVDNAEDVLIKYQKELDEVKEISLFDGFKQEEKLFQDLLRIVEDQILHLDDMRTKSDSNLLLNNFDKDTESKILNVEESAVPKSKKNNPFTYTISYSTSNNIVIYNFPEPSSKNNKDDVFDIKYFLSRFDIGNTRNITVRRLPWVPKNETIRPVVAALPDTESLDKVLSSVDRIRELVLLPNLRIARYYGKIKIYNR